MAKFRQSFPSKDKVFYWEIGQSFSLTKQTILGEIFFEQSITLESKFVRLEISAE